jgi:hypothetical protein
LSKYDFTSAPSSVSFKPCNIRVWFKPGTEVTVEIPQSEESPKDSQPLSIFTVGVEIDSCGWNTWPSELQNVEKILADKGTTRPYYANAKEKIADIQGHMSQAATVGDEICGDINKNDILGSINIFELPPGYGKIGPSDSEQHYVPSSTNDFHL